MSSLLDLLCFTEMRWVLIFYFPLYCNVCRYFCKNPFLIIVGSVLVLHFCHHQTSRLKLVVQRKAQQDQLWVYAVKNSVVQQLTFLTTRTVIVWQRCYVSVVSICGCVWLCVSVSQRNNSWNHMRYHHEVSWWQDLFCHGQKLGRIWKWLHSDALCGMRVAI